MSSLFLLLCQECAEQEQSDPEWSRITLKQKGVDNKNRKQPWPQLVYYTSIFCCICDCVFQENGIVIRSSRKEQCKGTPNPRLWSPFQSSGATLQPIQYYYVILGLTPIILRALRHHLTHFPCSDPSYRCRDTKTLQYIMQIIPSRSLI